MRDIAIVEFANGLAFSCFVPFLALWLTGPVGMSPVGAAITGFGVYSLTAIAGGLAGGVLSDRIGRRPVMLAGLAAGTLRLALLALTTDPVLVTVLIAFGGFVDSAVVPAANALVADRVRPGRLNEAFGTVRAARTLALGLGPVLGAALAPLSFAAVLAAAAGCRAVACLAAAFVREPGRRAKRAPRVSSRAFRDHALLAVLAGTIVMALFYGWYDTVVPVHLEGRGLSVTTWGAIYAGGAIFMASLAIPVARTIDRRPRFVAWIAGGAITYAAGFALLLPGEIATVIPGVALIMVAQMILNPLESTLVALLAPRGRTGAYQGALSVVYSIAFATGPVLGLGLYDATSAGLTLRRGRRRAAARRADPDRRRAACDQSGSAALDGGDATREGARRAPDHGPTRPLRTRVPPLGQATARARGAAQRAPQAAQRPIRWRPRASPCHDRLPAGDRAHVRTVRVAEDALETGEFVTVMTVAALLAITGAVHHAHRARERAREVADRLTEVEKLIAQERKRLDQTSADLMQAITPPTSANVATT